MDERRAQRMAEERTQLKAEYEAWRKQPFTELFISYFLSGAERHKDDAVSPDNQNRDKSAHFYDALSLIATAPDMVYYRADNALQAKFEQEEAQDESNKSSGPSGAPDGFGALDI